AFDNQLLLEHLNQLINGKSIQMPLYSFQNYTRKKITKKVEPAEVIILEGILVLEEKAIRNLLDIKIYVDTDSDERFIRRLIRDTSKRKRSLNSVVEQYLNRVKPMFLQFVEPSKRYADIIIPQGGLNKVAIDIITSKINAQLTQVNKS
ncbi:MAG TPA: uridine kinase, partial [Atribacterota bacterium]|nr:uridine kinase [Atribacterota bacterium]